MVPTAPERQPSSHEDAIRVIELVTFSVSTLSKWFKVTHRSGDLGVLTMDMRLESVYGQVTDE